MDSSITLREQSIKGMAFRSFVLDAGRDSHKFTAGTNHAKLFQAAYDQFEVEHASGLNCLRPAVLRRRPIDEVSP